MQLSEKELAGAKGTYLGLYCLGLIEICWLAAVSAVPLLYNPHSLSGFDSAKVALVRLLAAITATAWAIALVDQPRVRTDTIESGKRLWRIGVTVPIGLLCIAYILANCLSPYRSISFWGTYDYFQGTFTFFCLEVLFGAVATFLRRSDQLERLTTTILAVSVPISIYAIVQRFGFDPLSFEGGNAPNARSFSLIGNANFLGAYLGFVLPLTLMRVLQTTRRQNLFQGTTNQPLAVVRFFLYLSVGFFQIAALFCTQSRGPLLGIATSLFIFTLIGAALSRRRRAIATVIVLVLVGCLFVIILNLPHGPLQKMRSLPVLERMAEMLPMGRGLAESSNSRSTVWAVAVQIMFTTEPWLIPGRGPDVFHLLRPLVGYGPDTTAAVLRHYLIEPGVSWDKFHNLVLDTWLTLGLPGVVGTLLLFLILFFVGLQSLRLIDSAKERRIFFGVSCSVSLLFAIIVIGLRLPGFVGFGLQIGLIASIALFVSLKAWRVKPFAIQPHLPAVSLPLVVAILAALAGYLVESSFSFDATVALAFFWVYAGALIAVTDPDFGKEDGKEVASLPFDRIREIGRSAFVPAVSLVVILFGFIYLWSTWQLGVKDVFVGCFLKLRTSTKASYLLVWLLPAIWLLPCLITSDRPSSSPRSGWLSRFGWSLLIAGIIGGLYGAVKAFQIVRIGPLPSEGTTWQEALSQAVSNEWLVIAFAITLIFLLLTGGFIFAMPSARLHREFKWTSVLVAGFSISALAVCFFQGLKQKRAESLMHWGGILELTGSDKLGLGIRRQAVRLAPQISVNRVLLARSSIAVAEKMTDESEFERLMTEAEQELLSMRSQFSRGSIDTDLGDLYLRWAVHEKAPDLERNYAQKAARFLTLAVEDERGYEPAWVQAAIVDEFLGRQAESGEKMRMADQLTASQISAEAWAGYYSGIVGLMPASALKNKYSARGVDLYERLARLSTSRTEALQFRLKQVALLSQVLDYTRAIATSQEAIRLAPTTELWQAERALAESYLGLGDVMAALNAMNDAISHAPPPERESLEKRRNAIQNL